MLKKIMLPGGRRFKMGRKRPIAEGPRLHMRNYLLQTLPTPPVSVDYTIAAAPFLADVLGNDVAGNCTAAGVYHIEGTLLGNAGAPIVYTAEDALHFYMQLSGWNGIEDDPSDTGLACQDVLNYWQTRGLLPSGSKISGWVALDATNMQQVQCALWWFENLYIGMELPDAWLNPTPSASGFIWGLAGESDPSNGHCIMAAKYDASGITIDTWGMQGLMPWNALAYYASRANGGELYSVLSADILVSALGKSPGGMNWTQLMSDMQSLGPVQ